MGTEFNFNQSLIPKKEIVKLLKKIEPEFNRLKYAAMQKGKDERSVLLVPSDFELLEKVKMVINEKKALHPEIIVLIGIGGSNLGVMAAEDFVIDRFSQHIEGKPKILYADSVDTESMSLIIRTVEMELAKGKNVIFNVVSKSGLTIETISNFEVLINILQTYKDNYKDYIVVTAEKDTLLWNWADSQKIRCLEIPEYVVGRYSVFSAAGLFPLGMIGVKIEEVLKGAREMHKRCLEVKLNDNPAAISAATQYYYYKKKMNISNLFLFGKNLENLGKWHRQLMAESIGKEKSLKGKKVNAGITPIVSIGTNDLHSIEQLCIGGPNDKFTTFVTIREHKSEIQLPLTSKTGLAKYLQGFNLNQLSHYITGGVEEAYRKIKRPFIGIELMDLSENSIGQFMMWKMIETIFLAHLMDVNPFDQPAVESYKSATRKILSINSPLEEEKRQ